MNDVYVLQKHGNPLGFFFLGLWICVLHFIAISGSVSFNSSWETLGGHNSQVRLSEAVQCRENFIVFTDPIFFCFFTEDIVLCPPPSWKGSPYLYWRLQTVWWCPGSQTGRATCGLSVMSCIHTGEWRLWPNGSGSRYRRSSQSWKSGQYGRRTVDVFMAGCLPSGHHIGTVRVSTGFTS